jgi:hypothetical protein
VLIGYCTGVRGAIFVFLGMLSASCGTPPRPKAESGPRPAVSTERAGPTLTARVTRCVATPSTIYGDEVVSFELEGEGEGQARVELFDQRQQRVFRGLAAVRGRLPVPDLPSGDFTLRIDEASVSCQVTVNRELPRASSAGR